MLGTFGGENVPMVGFGFGDAVIMELLATKGLVPEKKHAVDDVVVCMDDSLRPAACGVAAKYVSTVRYNLLLHCLVHGSSRRKRVVFLGLYMLPVNTRYTRRAEHSTFRGCCSHWYCAEDVYGCCAGCDRQAR